MSRTVPDDRRRRFALFVGINSYGAAGDLKGCLNDVSGWKALLLENGWRSSHIRVLLDAQATRVHVMQGLRWLVSHHQPDDSLWFHFSGHGSWTLTPEGRGWECCICCVDCAKDWDAGIITKTDFNAALARPDGSVFVVLDSCFSGGMAAGYPPHRRLPAKVRRLLFETGPGRGVRALPGPEWQTLETACRRLGLSRKEAFGQVAQGTLVARRVMGGPLHLRLSTATHSRANS